MPGVPGVTRDGYGPGSGEKNLIVWVCCRHPGAFCFLLSDRLSVISPRAGPDKIRCVLAGSR